MSRTEQRILPYALASLVLASTAFAQGSDSCSTPTILTGTGTFPFDNTSAATGAEGQNESLCFQFGTSLIQFDVWFVWTATADGAATMSLCGGTSIDTKIAAYAGDGCPGTPAIACNDDECGFQSQILFDVTAGTTYTLQLGTSRKHPGGSGTFSLSIGPPPPPCGPNTGPDVIVGDIGEVLNVFPLGGIDAIAFGTTSCNIGTDLLNWIPNTTDHPVIRQNLYRYDVVGGAARFEQIGMSWLKHGFTALQGSLCCPCQPGGDGQHLGVGCSDPYSANLNGSQSGLGPNWQVDAHTGVFTYPPANPAHGSDSIYRRCQVALADLEVTGGGNTTRYFGECQYVTRDDAAAGNQNNNASWREVTVSGSSTNYDVGLFGATQRGDPAIRAWALIDASVHLDELQIPSDGLVILGSRASDVGGGRWRYEYAVYNMNSDRNVGSVSVPVPATASITNIGFHDVPYHDGDGPGDVNFSGTDWPATRAGGSITWACETQTQNASANAIRWGTQYNFRFDADVAPQTGSITLGLWKSAAPASITGTGEVPGAGPARISSFCFGDGTGGVCPCINYGIAGRGCDNSYLTGGALLVGSGNPSLAADTLVLTSSEERPTSLTVFWQGSTETAAATFGDGVACFGKPGLRRLYFKNAVGGTATAPQGAEPPVSSRSTATGDPLSPGDARVYHAFYRDPDPTFCASPAGSTFNTSNGLRVTWAP